MSLASLIADKRRLFVVALGILAIIGIWTFVYLDKVPEDGVHFRVNDDYTIVETAFDFEQGKETVSSVVKRHGQQEGRSRFRPGWYWLYYGQIKILGANANLWLVSSLAWGALTTICLQLVGLYCFRSIALGSLFALFTVSGEQFQVFIRTAPSEKFGIAFYAVSLLLCVGAVRTGRRAVSAALLVSAIPLIFVKETFLIAIPSLVAFLYVLSCLNDDEQPSTLAVLRKHRVVVAMLMAYFVLGLSWVMIKVDNDKLSLDLFAMFLACIKAMMDLLRNNPVWFAMLGLPLILWLYHPKKRLLFFWAIVFFCLLVGPQILAYAKSEINGRYLLPASLGVQFLSFLVIAQFWNARIYWNSRIPAKALASIALIAIAISEAKATNYSVDVWMWHSNLQAFLYSKVVQNAEKHEQILIVADPGYGHEMLSSSNIYLQKLYGYHDLKFLLYKKDSYDTSRWPFDYLADMNTERYSPRKLEGGRDEVLKSGAIIVWDMRDDFFKSYELTEDDFTVYSGYNLYVLIPKT